MRVCVRTRWWQSSEQGYQGSHLDWLLLTEARTRSIVVTNRGVHFNSQDISIAKLRKSCKTNKMRDSMCLEFSAIVDGCFIPQHTLPPSLITLLLASSPWHPGSFRALVFWINQLPQGIGPGYCPCWAHTSWDKFYPLPYLPQGLIHPSPSLQILCEHPVKRNESLLTLSFKPAFLVFTAPLIIWHLIVFCICLQSTS